MCLKNQTDQTVKQSVSSTNCVTSVLILNITQETADPRPKY